jgi:hypothetical protein
MSLVLLMARDFWLPATEFRTRQLREKLPKMPKYGSHTHAPQSTARLQDQVCQQELLIEFEHNDATHDFSHPGLSVIKLPKTDFTPALPATLIEELESNSRLPLTSLLSGTVIRAEKQFWVKWDLGGGRFKRGRVPLDCSIRGSLSIVSQRAWRGHFVVVCKHPDANENASVSTISSSGGHEQKSGTRSFKSLVWSGVKTVQSRLRISKS